MFGNSQTQSAGNSSQLMQAHTINNISVNLIDEKRLAEIQKHLAEIQKHLTDIPKHLAEIPKHLEEKLKNVAPEQIETPEPYIAVPAIQYISYCMDNHELRDMYANLLASSMNKIIKNEVHPGYIEIIKQLCPDEAKILKYMAEKEAIPTLSVFYGISKVNTKLLVKDFSNVGELVGCERPFDFNKYFDNLERLGLIKSSELSNSALADAKLYDELRENSYIQSITDKLQNTEDDQGELEFIEGYITITNYGIGFCNVCLGEQPLSPQDINKFGDNKIQYKRHTDTMDNEDFNEILDNIFKN